ncbi:MAG: hypothetical protein DMG11_23275, partial [Acidobacteria bacterium]
MKLYAVLALLLVVPQTAISIQPQEPASKASIEGTVVQAGTAKPIQGARLTFRSNADPPGRTAPGPFAPEPMVSIDTDSQGKFTIRNLDAGAFHMTVAANGYVRQEWPEARLNLTAGQTLKDVVIELTPAGVVYGVIRDETGHPAVDIQVQLLQPRYKFGGQRSFQKARSAATNDRGEYRLYYVTPGRYYLAASSISDRFGLMRLAQDNPNAIQDNFALSYYPGVADFRSARPIEVQPGADSIADLSVHREQFYKIRGHIIDSRTGQPPAAVTVWVESEGLTGDNVLLKSDTTYNAGDGTFEVRDVPPGSYVVRAEFPEGGGPALSGKRARGLTRVTVFDSNVDGVVMNIVAAASISGRLTIEGGELSGIPADFATVRSLPYSQALNPDGTFRIDDVMPGEYQVVTCIAMVTNSAGCIRSTPDFYLKSARFDSTDVLNKPLQFAGATPTPLDIVLSPKPAQIDGTVLNGKQQPAANIQVVLIPDRNRDRSDLYKLGLTDSIGHFTIRGITPGAYKVFAWEA